MSESTKVNSACICVQTFMCEQVLFVRFTLIPPRLTDQCNFITVL